MSLSDILKEKGFGNASTIAITCVDPDYPVTSIGVEADTHYTPGDHDLGGHVQRTEGMQAFMVYDADTNSFHEVAQESVHDSLGKGIIQIAYDGETMTLGIPGDVYAFNRNGTGFAFDNPHGASADVAHYVLDQLVDVAQPNKIVAMAHPDCGLVAHNEGKHDLLPLAQNINGEYESSMYAANEGALKNMGSVHLEGLVNFINARPGMDIELEVIRPKYVERVSGAYKVANS